MNLIRGSYYLVKTIETDWWSTAITGGTQLRKTYLHHSLITHHVPYNHQIVTEKIK